MGYYKQKTKIKKSCKKHFLKNKKSSKKYKGGKSRTLTLAQAIEEKIMVSYEYKFLIEMANNTPDENNKEKYTRWANDKKALIDKLTKKIDKLNKKIDGSIEGEVKIADNATADDATIRRVDLFHQPYQPIQPERDIPEYYGTINPDDVGKPPVRLPNTDKDVNYVENVHNQTKWAHLLHPLNQSYQPIQPERDKYRKFYQHQY